jgi:predicted heme/steroid binding protein
MNLQVPTSGFNQIANQLDIGDGTNGINEVLKGSALVSDANGVNNTVVYIWQKAGQGYLTVQYYNAADAASWWGGTQAGFYDLGGNFVDPALPPGSSFFMQNYNNTSSNLTVTLVGSVLQQTNVVAITPGYQTVALGAPVATSLVLSNNYVGVSDPNGVNNDVLYSWNVSGQGFLTLQYYNLADAISWWGGTQAGFYDLGGNFVNYTPNAGQPFFIQRVTGDTTYFTNSFNIQ